MLLNLHAQFYDSLHSEMFLYYLEKVSMAAARLAQEPLRNTRFVFFFLKDASFLDLVMNAL